MRIINKLVILIIMSWTMVGCNNKEIVIRTTDPNVVGRWKEVVEEGEEYSLISLAGSGYYSKHTYTPNNEILYLQTSNWYSDGGKITLYNFNDGDVILGESFVYQSEAFSNVAYFNGKRHNKTR